VTATKERDEELKEKKEPLQEGYELLNESHGELVRRDNQEQVQQRQRMQGSAIGSNRSDRVKQTVKMQHGEVTKIRLFLRNCSFLHDLEFARDA